MAADAFTPKDMTPPVATLAEEVQAGLPAAMARLVEAQANEDFYQMENERHLEKRPNEEQADFDARPKRYSRLTRTVIRRLTKPLYKPGPTRVWEGDETIQDFLDGIYQDVQINSRMASADRAATLNDVAALQIEATGDPEKPLRYWLWKAHEFEVFLFDNDPVNPWAVCTIERIRASLGQMMTRYRLWSAWERVTYLTEPWNSGRTTGGRRAERMVPEESGPTPYPGVLPFVFVRNEPPDCRFWEGGIGSALREANESIDREMSDLAEHVEAFLNPLPWAKNLPAETRMLHKVGRFIHLPNMPGQRVGDMRSEPEIGYLQAQLGVEAAWLDIQTFADNTLEELEVPLTIVRSDAAADFSGAAIIEKQVPLIEYTQARQGDFAETEKELAAKSLAVVSVFYDGGESYRAAAEDPQLVCVWPEPRPSIATSERNVADQWELDQGLADPIEILARRRGLTLDQAEQLARNIADRRKLWNEIMADVQPAMGGGSDEENLEEEEDDGEATGARNGQPVAASED
jgi:hypothetical protein